MKILYKILKQKSTVKPNIILKLQNFSKNIVFADNNRMIYEQKKENLDTKKERKGKYAILTGMIAGIVNGLFGGGGGMIVVPMLIKLLDCPPKKAHATAILIILPLSITSGIIYAVFGNLNLRVGIPVGIGVVLGGVVGALLLSKLSSKVVIIIFSILMAAAGVKMLIF